MNIFHTIILGLVEGITEFIPVSSTAHLILVSKLLGLSQNSFISTFEVVIQSGAILAVMFIYGKKLLTNKHLFTLVIASFLPTAIIGYTFHNLIKNVFFQSDTLIVGAIGFIGLLFILVELFFKKHNIKLDRNESSMIVRDALIIGVIQSFAIVPGVSRAGAVIIAMILLRFNRKFAAEYSFLLAIPTILAATGLDLLKFNGYFTSARLFYFGIGFVTAFVSAIFVVRWFTKYLEKHNLIMFGLYRILLALGFFMFL